MEPFFISHGLLGLFIASFLASTLIPFGSEWLLIALITHNIHLPSVVATATAGNFLGACLTYWIGLAGSTYLTENIWRVSPETQERAHKLYRQYGSWSLLLSWVPIIGDPLCLISGSLRFKFSLFSILVFSGKLVRYLIVALIAKGIF